MIIELEKDVSRIRYESKSGMKEKVVKTQELLVSLTESVGQTTPLLPPNTRMLKTNKNVTKLFLEVPPTVRKIRYRAKEKVIFDRVSFPMPWTLWVIELESVDNGRFVLREAYIYAMKGPIMDLDQKLFVYPTPNVFNSNKICFGGALSPSSLRRIDNLAQAYRFVNIFNDAEFNSDLHPKFEKEIRWEDLVRELKDAPEFDNDILKLTASLSSIMS